MKRILTTLLIVSVLLGMLCTSALAHERPLGGTTDTPVELTTITDTPDLTQTISLNLTAAPFMSKSMLNPGTQWNDAANAIGDLELADIANHLKYGFSVIGMSNLERGVGAAVDGVWAKGDYGDTNVTQFATTKQKGAFSWISSGKLYNVNGEAATEGKTAADGYVYQIMFTCNFGKVANLDSFAFAYPNTTGIGYPQAADVYVSDDGVNWTLVGYYDRVAKRMAGGDYENISGALLGKDAADATMSETHLFTNFDLPENTSAQFLRIAFTSAGGKTNPSNKTEYNTYSNAIGEKNAFREFFVFGTLTDEVKTPWMDPSDDPYLNATKQPEEDSTSKEDENDGPAPKPVTTAPKDTTDAPSTEAPATTEEPAENNGGCGSSISTGAAVAWLCTVGVAATVVGKKKKENN